jgi:hypothetical protein
LRASAVRHALTSWSRDEKSIAALVQSEKT